MSNPRVLFTLLLLLAARASLAADTPSMPGELFAVYDELQDALANAAHEVAADAYAEIAHTAAGLQGTELESLRQAYAPLSRAMARLARDTGYDGVRLYHCPMANAYWLQPTAETTVANPYYGASMSRCGARVDHLD